MLFFSHFGGFLGILYSCLFGFGRFSVRWGPKGPTSPNPSLFGVYVFLVFVFLLFSFIGCFSFCFVCVCWSVFGVVCYVYFIGCLIVIDLLLFVRIFFCGGGEGLLGGMLLFCWFVCWSVLVAVIFWRCHFFTIWLCFVICLFLFLSRCLANTVFPAILVFWGVSCWYNVCFSILFLVLVFFCLFSLLLAWDVLMLFVCVLSFCFETQQKIVWSRTFCFFPVIFFIRILYF